MADTPRPTWEEVLAAVEQDIAQTERVLRAPAEHAPAGAPVAPADLQLLAAGPVLPPLAQMPVVPAQLGARIDAARTRVAELQQALHAELQALSELRAAQAAHAVRAARLAASARAGHGGPALFDSRV